MSKESINHFGYNSFSQRFINLSLDLFFSTIFLKFLLATIIYII
jgi:hypothetical protein